MAEILIETRDASHGRGGESPDGDAVARHMLEKDGDRTSLGLDPPDNIAILPLPVVRRATRVIREIIGMEDQVLVQNDLQLARKLGAHAGGLSLRQAPAVEIRRRAGVVAHPRRWKEAVHGAEEDHGAVLF